MCRIGKYSVSPALAFIWNSLEEQHIYAKNSKLSKKLKSHEISLTSWIQNLIDRKAIFKAIESRISLLQVHNSPCSILKVFPKRSELISNAWKFSHHSPHFESTSIFAKRIITSIQSSSDEEIEWIIFIHYGELWFGGSVHAQHCKYMIKHNKEWKEYFLPDVDESFVSPSKFSAIRQKQCSHFQNMLKQITSWFIFEDYPSQSEMVSNYFSLLSYWVLDDEEKQKNAITICKETMEAFTQLNNQ